MSKTALCGGCGYVMDEGDYARHACIGMVEWLRSQLAATEERATTAERERDALRRHYDAAGPEHNLLELLDLYFERQTQAERERDTARADADRCREVLGPFAAEAATWDPDDGDGTVIVTTYREVHPSATFAALTVGDLRRAKRAMEEVPR